MTGLQHLPSSNRQLMFDLATESLEHKHFKIVQPHWSSSTTTTTLPSRETIWDFELIIPKKHVRRVVDNSYLIDLRNGDLISINNETRASMAIAGGMDVMKILGEVTEDISRRWPRFPDMPFLVGTLQVVSNIDQWIL